MTQAAADARSAIAESPATVSRQSCMCARNMCFFEYTVLTLMPLDSRADIVLREPLGAALCAIDRLVTA